MQTVHPFLLAAVFLGISTCSDIPYYESYHVPRDASGLEKRQAQFIINPCPEFFGDPPQYCSDCGGDSYEKGVCNNIRLNGLQDRFCHAQGGCGIFCRCRPDMRYNGPVRTVQFIAIYCPESYGLPMQKCSEPRCGGDVYYEGICDNILVSGAQGPGCPKGGCGISCKCDTTPGEDPPAPTATTIILSGDEPIVATSHAPYVHSDLPEDTTEVFITSGDPGPPTSILEISNTYSSTNTVPSLPTTVSLEPSSVPSSTSMQTSGSSSLIYITGPLPEPTSLISTTRAAISTANGIPIKVPIFPIPPPAAGFPPPPPGTRNPQKQCGSPQDVKCSDCGGVEGWCQEAPHQGCMCQDACTEGEYQPDCKADECEGEDGKCTVGSQKDCDCKSCPEGIDAPLCTNEECNGGQSGKCEEGTYEACDCFIVPTSSIADYYDLAWGTFQQQMIDMLSAGDPGWMYTTVTGGFNVSVTTDGTSSPTILPASTTAKNASISTRGAPSGQVPLNTSISHTVFVTSSRTANTSSIPTPDCMFDWDPEYGPEQFWCDCGPGSTYPIIPPTSGATASETVTGDCNYSVLPATTINPTPTGTPAAKVPGQYFIAGCVYELAAYNNLPNGTENYCFCAGGPSVSAAYAPLLTHSATCSGRGSITDCDYTTQPTPGWTPSVTGIYTTKSRPSPTSLKTSSKTKSSVAAHEASSAAVPVETINKSKCDDEAWYGTQSECDTICFPEVCTEVDDHFSNEFSNFVCEC